MSIVGAVASTAVIGWILVEAFEAMVLPRRVMRKFRFNRWYYRLTWPGWLCLSRVFAAPKRRETFLSLFGPLSLLGLFSSWVVGLIVAFALLHWSLGTPLLKPAGPVEELTELLYFSGITFFTIGYGDVVPAHGLGRFLAVVEGGIGFGFLAIIIGYTPVLYQAFSRREVVISLFDARAGSPPSAGQLLLRIAPHFDAGAASNALAEWERWAAELLESHLSFPVLSFYRSQHDNQSWLAALTTILDTCALIMAAAPGKSLFQAQLTFAMARHAAVDLALVMHTPPRPVEPDRLPSDAWQQLCEQLHAAGLEVRQGPAVEAKLSELRGMYEPFVNALAHFFQFQLPPLFTEKTAVDNWQTSAWTRRTAGFRRLPVLNDGDEHFD
ncbi:MAG TPA: potassium channel family protein [Gemmataceae bacterium]|nr:potassium channel family protein [Gemmataceae bacterium]